MKLYISRQFSNINNGINREYLKLYKKLHCNLRYFNFFCYFCPKTSDNESNSQQIAETDTVANSLPLFYPFL